MPECVRLAAKARFLLMLLESSFDVPASPEQAWDLLMDVPRVIPCMPGTTLTETVGDSAWKARLEIKLGPVSLAFATDVEREEADREAMRAILTATAREVRGRGGGRARIESTLTPSGGGTRVVVRTDLRLTGTVAQTRAGLVEAVSARLVQSFADCLEAQLAAAPAEAEAAVAAQARPVRGFSFALRALLGKLAGKFRRPSGSTAP
jgi:carbon monoxide dehydrogenase subunit G